MMKYFTLSVIFTTVVISNGIRPSQVISGSMQPNFPIGTHTLVLEWVWGLNIPFQNKQFMQWRQPKHGDVVIFHNPHDQGKLWMKRVIAEGGDWLEFHHHHLYLNGVLCDTHHHEKLPLRAGGFSPSYAIWSSYLEQDWGPIQIPQGQLFLMGDNRGDSVDSRQWGSLERQNLVGMPWLLF